MFSFIFLFTILLKTWTTLQFQSFMRISREHRPKLEEIRVVSSFMLLSIELISPQRIGWAWTLNWKQNSSGHKGKAMESDCPSHCELKLPCFARCRCQKPIEFTLQHPEAAKEPGFQFWSSCEQNKLLHKLLKAACAPQMMTRKPGSLLLDDHQGCQCLIWATAWVSNSLLGSHTSLLLMLFLCFSVGQQVSVTYGFVFITPGLWARKNRDFLGTVLGSVPSSWFQRKDHELRDPTVWIDCLAELCLSQVQLELLL